MAAIDDDEYEIPLRDQRVFGASLKRKRVKFVPSSTNGATVQSLPTTPSASAADQYLSIVFNKSVPAERSVSAPPTDEKLEDGSSRGVRSDWSVFAGYPARSPTFALVADVDMVFAATDRMLVDLVFTSVELRRQDARTERDPGVAFYDLQTMLLEHAIP